MTVSQAPSGSAPIDVMRPSLTPTAPSTISRPSFIVTIVALRTIVDGTEIDALHRESGGRGAAADGNQFGEDADGDLRRSHSADVEADRRVNPLEAFGGQTLPEKGRVDPRDLRATANETQVAQIARRQRTHGVQIVLMAAGHHDHKRGRRNLGAMQPTRDGFDDDLGSGEAFRVGELLPIVDDVQAEAGVGGNPRQLMADVPRADDV